MKHPRDFGARRFFARVYAFTAACPHCDHVVQVHGPRAAKAYAAPRAVYDRHTSTWTCQQCGRQYTVALLAWPVAVGAGARGRPDDQVPDPHELAQLRPDRDGWALPDALRPVGRPSITNLTGEPERPERDTLDDDLRRQPETQYARRRTYYARNPRKD